MLHIMNDRLLQVNKLPAVCRALVFLCLFTSSWCMPPASAQSLFTSFPSSFRNTRNNELIEATSLAPVFKKLKQNKAVKVMQIGDSHVRGNYLPRSVGSTLQSYFPRVRFTYYGINGAGLYLIRCYDNPCSITNSLFANNTSGHFGGGLAISDSSPLVANLTVVNNHSIGVNCGGIFFYQQSSPVLWNCIVYGNTNEVPLDEPVQMWSWTLDDCAPEFHNCLVQFGFENISNHEIISVYENCIDADPLFADPDNENYQLDPDSPCINAGSPETPANLLNGLDLDGNQRVSDNCIDIGAYEYDPNGVQETLQNEQTIHIVGNPVTISSYAEIECESACNLFAKVYSVDGKLLVNKNLEKAQIGINRIEIGEWFQNLTSGTYLLVIRTPKNTFVAKIIK